MSKIIDLTCYQCKKEYTLTNHRYQTKVKRGVKKFFCSNECCYAWKRTPITDNCSCLVCNITFYRTRSQVEKSKSKNTFCSSSCAAKYNNKGIQRNPKKLRKCISCSAEYEFEKTRRSKLCLECSENRKSKHVTIKDCISNISVKGKHPSWKTTYVRQHNAIYNRKLKKLPCQNCGFDQHVELAHIKPVSSFSEEAKLVEVNAPENILVLCPNCHWMFDHNRLKLEEIPSRN